jgi:hypothetical protein
VHLKKHYKVFDEAKPSRHDGLAPADRRCAERLLIVLEINTFVPISVISAQKAASSPHHPDGENSD